MNTTFHSHSRKTISKAVHSVAIILIIFLLIRVDLRAEVDYLSGGEITGISSFTAGLMVLGHKVKQIDSTKKSLIGQPSQLEKSIQRFIGGDCRLGKLNFLDDERGSIITPVAAGVAITITNIFWPRDHRGRDVTEDLFLFTSGLMATKGVTDIAKGIVARERPLPCLAPGLAAQREESSYQYDHQSFFSGHASSAFFAATYANKRLRDGIRRENSPAKYKSYRWAPPLAMYGWASFVAWSRIHAHRHYLSDVTVGAIAGWLMGELFFSLAGELESPNSGVVQNQSVGPIVVRISVSF